QVEPLRQRRLHDGRSAGLPLHGSDLPASRRSFVPCQRHLLATSVVLIEYRRRRENYAPLGMHTRNGGAACAVTRGDYVRSSVSGGTASLQVTVSSSLQKLLTVAKLHIT